jgi:beta-lactamase regulating signal transducer with metallopeptidase domain
MIWLLIQNVAQIAMERVINSLPESFLVVLLGWLLLRLIGRQNSGTRFAVWFMALIAVVGLSLTGGLKLNESNTLLSASHPGSQVIIPSFWAVALFAAWGLVSLIALVRLFTGLCQVWTIRRGCREVDLAQLEPAIQDLFRQHETGRPVCLAVSEKAKVPAAIGFWKPVIMLPKWTLRELQPSELQPILIHELTHLKRRDDWTNLLQKFVRAVFFFHPAVWWIDSRLSIEREMACDDAVLEKTGNPRAYASCLVDLLEKSCARRNSTMVQAAVHHARELSQRITQILDVKRPSTTRIWKPALALSSIFSLACFGLSMYTPRLVAFAPKAGTSDSVEHMAKVHAMLQTDEANQPRTEAAVISASYDIPAPPAAERRTRAQLNKTAKPHKAEMNGLTAKNKRPQFAPQLLVAKAARYSGPMAQMVVYIETTTVSYAPAGDEYLVIRATTPDTRILEIMLIAPEQNTAHAELPASQI